MDSSSILSISSIVLFISSIILFISSIIISIPSIILSISSISSLSPQLSFLSPQLSSISSIILFMCLIILSISSIILSISWTLLHFEGILPKAPYLPCVSMAGRALLAGYPRFRNKWYGTYVHIETREIQTLEYIYYIRLGLHVVYKLLQLWNIELLRGKRTTRHNIRISNEHRIALGF